MVIYKVTGWTNPVDWASSCQPKIVGYFMTRKGANAKVRSMKAEKYFHYDWSSIGIDKIEVQP
jgi:hypothetical protein